MEARLVIASVPIMSIANVYLASRLTFWGSQ